MGGRARGPGNTAALIMLLGATSVVPAVAQSTEPPAPATGPALPEIGRTRSASPACTAMRELVIPVFALAQRADGSFAETRKRFPPYAEAAADDIDRNSVVRVAALARLGSDATHLLQQALEMRKVLDDPRLAPESKDPQIGMERALLEEVIAAHKARAALLSEFVAREDASLAIKRVGMEDSGMFVGKNRPIARTDDALPTTPKVPPVTAPSGMPLLTGLIPIADRGRLADWGATAALAVRNAENRAAKTFLTIAKTCP